MVQKRLIEASIETLKKELTFYQLPSFEKIALFKKRFFARSDVYAKERQNKKGYYPLKDNYESKTFAYVSLTDEAIKLHLQGRIRLGSYAMQKSNRCIFLVIDLDDKAHYLWFFTIIISVFPYGIVPHFCKNSFLFNS